MLYSIENKSFDGVSHWEGYASYRSSTGRIRTRRSRQTTPGPGPWRSARSHTPRRHRRHRPRSHRRRHGDFPDGDDHLVLGHEAVGVVEDPNGTDLDVGDVVVPTVRRRPNGENEYFARGEPDYAPEGQYVERGIVGAHGFMAKYFTSPADALVEIPESLTELGFLVEPASISEKAFDLAFASRSAFEWAPETAAVLGNGSLGLLTLAML